MTITLNRRTFTTTLYEKDLNLHLYIPPASAHPPGLLPGIVFGTLFRIQTLCSSQEDRDTKTKAFFRRLIVRGYQADQIKPLFYKAIARAKTYTGPAERNNNGISRDLMIFHLRYHPQDPPSYKIQQAWRDFVSEPRYKPKLENLKNPKTKRKLGPQRLILAYSRPMNLGNLLTHRRLELDDGPQVSSYYNPIGYL